MRSLWAAGLLLRRLRAERGIVLLLFLLVAASSFVFAAAPRLFNRAADAALVRAAQVPASERDLTLALASNLGAGTGGGVSGVRAYGERLAQDLPPSVTGLFSSRTVRITTVRLYVDDPPSYDTRISLRYQDGVTDATRLVTGRWPVDRGVPLRQPFEEDEGEEPVEPVDPVILEAALSTAAASEIGAEVGDRLSVSLDLTDTLLQGTRLEIVPTELEVVGLFEPIDPVAEYWSGGTGILQVAQGGSEENPIAYATAYVSADVYPNLASSDLPFRYEWRFHVDPQRLVADQVAQLQFDLHRLGLITGSADAAGSGTVAVLTSLPEIIDEYARERALTESVLSIAALGPFGLAAGAIAMVAFLLVRRRRGALALARGRGASGSLVLGTQLWEAILLAGSASLVGLLAAITLVPARASPLSPALAIAIAGTATLLLVGASWTTARRTLGQVERDDPPGLRVAPRRLVIELTIVAIAVAATLLLRERGLTIDTPGEAARFDPLLAAVPVLAGLAAGIVAVRLYPLPIRALGWLAGRRRDLVPVLGLRTIGRHPAAASLPLLVLLLTAAFSAFSSVIASSLDRGQVDASYLDVGADYRVEATALNVLGPQDPAAKVPMDAVAPGLVDPTAAFASSPSQRTSIYMEAIDPLAYEQVTAGTAADPRWPGELTAEPSGTGIGTEDNPIPALLSTSLPGGNADLGIGDTFQVTVNGKDLTFQLIEQRASFPGIGQRSTFAVLPYNWIKAAFGDQLVLPSVLWLRGPAEAAGPLADAVANAPTAQRLVSRYDAYRELHEAPLGAFIGTGYRLALVIAATYMALTIVGSLVLSAARRTRDLAYLRTLGVTGRQALALTVMEHAPPVLLALLPGVVLGIGVAILCEPGLGLATFVGARDIPLFVDWTALAILVAALIGVVTAAVIAGTWLSRRGRLVDALRIGDD